jgi:hypothetical protein
MPYLDGSSFDENLSIKFVPQSQIVNRLDVLVDICRGRSVIHIGCTDHPPLIPMKIRDGTWLHGLLTDVASEVVGVDINADAVREARQQSGLSNMHVGDITSKETIDAIRGRKFDIALFGEVVEHIPDPVTFLRRFGSNYGAQVKRIVITVPNAFRSGNIRGILAHRETINSDHRFFFTPYTISKIAVDAGFQPDKIIMATFTKAGRLKSWLLSLRPLLAEDIILIGRTRETG